VPCSAIRFQALLRFSAATFSGRLQAGATWFPVRDTGVRNPEESPALAPVTACSSARWRYPTSACATVQ
jgi:hypothetical protein